MTNLSWIILYLSLEYELQQATVISTTCSSYDGDEANATHGLSTTQKTQLDTA